MPNTPHPPLNNHVFAIDIAAPRQRVWDEITKTGRIQLALNNTVLESPMTPGSKLRYYSPNRKRVFVVGEIVEVTPPRRFSHTFKLLMNGGDAPSLVTWDLEETPAGCRVTLTHSGWTDQVKTHKGTAAGWRGILSVLKQQLETGDIPLKTKVTYALMGAMMFMLPKATKVDEVAKAGW
jgi:uncharacterized protein YndB with AHSA1/START domain